MNSIDFENQFFSNLQNGNRNCLNDIQYNSKLINECYCEKGDIKSINRFVNRFNDCVLSNKDGYELYEEVLRHPSFDNLFYEFRNSDVMVRACQLSNESAIKWLMNMSINSCIQDNNGVTALMYASEKPNLINAVKYLCDPNCINLVDKYNQTALFYAVNNIDAFRVLIDSRINVNQLNIDNDSVLTYCCKNKIYEPLRTLGVCLDIDYNIFNNDDMTAAMYLIEDGRSLELKYIINKKMNFYYMNKNKETAISILFKKLYQFYQNNDKDEIVKMHSIIKLLVDSEISLNTSIDEDGNTPLMYLIMLEDWCAIIYILIQSNDINLSLKNAQGESAITLAMNLSQKKFEEKISSDFEVNVRKLLELFVKRVENNEIHSQDRNGNNLLMYSAYFDSKESSVVLSTEFHEMTEHVNVNQETPLIVCAKLGSLDAGREILKSRYTGINKKDVLGNTALHYAIQLNDYSMVNLLGFYKADQYIRNNEGLTPLDMAKKDKTMLNILKHSVSPQEFEKKKNTKPSLFNSSPKFKPVNEKLCSKYREFYTPSMYPKVAYQINKEVSTTSLYENILKTYYSNVNDLMGLHEQSGVNVPNTGNIICMVKRTKKFVGAVVAADVGFSLFDIFF